MIAKTITASIVMLGASAVMATEVTFDFHGDNYAPSEATPDVDGDGSTCEESDCGTATCAEDVNGDGMVNVNDILAVIAGWGMCP